MTIAMYSRTSWREVEPDFTVGQTDGDFTGTVARVGDRFEATTSTGSKIGLFRSVESAQRALERAADREDGVPRSRSTQWQLPMIVVSLALVCSAAMTAVISL